MSLEQAIEKLTAAVEANTAAVKAGGGKPAATSAASTTKETTKETTKPAAAAKGEHTRDEMIAALNKVKESSLGAPGAKALIKEVGGVDKMADIPDSKIDAVFNAATKKLEGDGDSGDGL